MRSRQGWIGSLEKATILVVDDNGQLRETLKEALRTLGYHTVTASSAEAALRVLDHSAPDLILADVRMGGMTGIDLCARLKQNPRFQLTPVILLTALSRPRRPIGGPCRGRG